MKDNGSKWGRIHLLINTICRMKFITREENTNIRGKDIHNVVTRLSNER